ncbi:MAG TPA: phosphoenolpyruvate carboxykinase (GTP) [Candidatus Marinimicrobia bacterium]|nr:phosphoenolpyruvate carboxykinase (GTP) [Candidatus Neomarinimicrobiota bacterium]
MNTAKQFFDKVTRDRLNDLHNDHVINIVDRMVRLCRPSKVTVITDDAADIAYVRRLALLNGEEKPLTIRGHSIHYDGYYDQGRDKDHTRVLLPKDKKLGRHINTIDRDEGLKEIFDLMDGIMEGKEMLVRFFSLGPLNSGFSIPALQITDSAYVAHSEDLLYRSGYEEFKKLEGKPDFFYFVHSAGQLDELGKSKDIDQRRIYVDIEKNRVFTINNQYAGNSLGLKKLALRLAINKSNHEDWLTEHMFIMGVHQENKNRTTYFSGAFPSACGKTSTAMIPGQTIIGDDIAFLRMWHDGSCHAVNIESGIFGIITNVNPVDDPLIYQCLTTPRELIFSNVLVNDGKPYWLGMGQETPKTGVNHFGDWSKGKKDTEGREIPLAHKNARYTIRLRELDNVDPEAENPDGVQIDGIIYGGRDSDTNVPICQSLDWDHGVFLGACLESETTAATLGQEGLRKHSPMANLDFVVVPLRKYIANHFAFGRKLQKRPLIFTTNYFLKDDQGNYLLDKIDKKIWLLWAEARVHGEVDALATPIGYIPLFQDLQAMFETILHKPFSRELYERVFSLRVENLLQKLIRIENIYREENMPEIFWSILRRQRERLTTAQQTSGADLIPPSGLKNY